MNPRLVIILSGKRKSGKDHISKLIEDHIESSGRSSDLVAVLQIASPIKREFANNNELDFGRLLDSSDYKENFRRAMVDWSERYRMNKGWNCFLEQAIREQRAGDRAIWILNDARRLCDVEYFDENPDLSRSKIVKLRIESTEDVRASRGWQFVEGIDDRDTERGLDNYNNWTLVIKNNSNDQESLDKELHPIFRAIDDALRDPELIT